MTARFPVRPEGIAYGGDYNPEQWPADIQADDVRLMREAGVNLVSLGIFTWVLMEPREGFYDFGWLDEIIDRLHAHGIAVDLGTPTAAPPVWFSRQYPQSLPVTREGIRIGFGGRESACPSSPQYRAATARLAEALATHYKDHPAVVLWHVHNEYGAPLGECYCDASVTAFRHWLRHRYGTLDALNDAWGTTFWGQRYGEWAEIDVPRHNHTVVNPAQRLDFARFTSDEHLACFTLQRDILHRLAPGIPVTTNFMTTNCKSMDLWKWAREVDVVSNDHYLNAEEPDNHIVLSMAADLSRSLGAGRPWLLMEHSTSAVSWQPRNLAKRPRELRRNSLTHLARGADAVLFFQWRASRFGAEKFHSAMLPQAGTNTQVWRDVVALGQELQDLSGVRGEPVPAEVALVWDWESYWALELEWRPSADLSYRERMDAYYSALWRAHTTVDFVHPEADLSRYKVVVAPSLYLLGEAGAKNLRQYAEQGGHLVVSFFSGIVGENDAAPMGPYPGALRDTLGLWIEEFRPLRTNETVALTGPSGTGTTWIEESQPSRSQEAALSGPLTTGTIWSERLHLSGAIEVARFETGPDTGHPAVTRHDLGTGSAWYVATALSDLRPFLLNVLDAAGVTRDDLPAGLEAVRRGEYLFLLNHNDHAVSAYGVTIDAGDSTVLLGEDLVAGRIVRQEPVEAFLEEHGHEIGRDNREE